MSDAATAPSPGGGRRRVDPVAAARLLDRAPPEGYRAEWTGHLARLQGKADAAAGSALVFRAGGEWLALPTAWVSEIAPPRAVHSLPHRRNAALAGIVNVRGELLPCLLIEGVLGLEPSPSRASTRRLCVAGGAGRRLAFPVDEVQGVVHYHAAARLAAPGRLPHVRHLLTHKDRPACLLDPDALWVSFERSLA